MSGPDTEPPTRQCTGTTRTGARCKRTPPLGQETCDKHTETDGTCTAMITGGNTRTDQAGTRCRNPAEDGTTVCLFHGAGAPQVAAAAERRTQEHRVRGTMRTYGKRMDITATDALLAEVQYTAGHVSWLRKQVRALGYDPGDRDEADDPFDTGPQPDTGSSGARRKAGGHPLVWGVTRSKTGGDDWGVTEAAAPNVYLVLYMKEREHLLKVCAAAIRCGLDERRVRLAEQQGRLVAQVIRGVLADLGLDEEQQAMVSTVVPRHLRLLSNPDLAEADAS